MTDRSPLKNGFDLKTIGDVALENPFFLAPMAGVSDAPMRRICREMGASFTCSEMISAKALYYGDRKTAKISFLYPGEGPTALQIFGHEPDIIAFAAEKLAPLPNAVLDINMGCPVPKIVKNGDGSALMKDPDLCERLVRAAVSAAGKPVTVKIRAGFTEKTKNAVEVAQACEAGGAAMIAVHGRTREAYYSGEPDLSVIRAVKAAVEVPVAGNGNVSDAASCLRMLRETECDFVMVARAARGNPWIFRDLLALWEGTREPAPPDLAEKAALMSRQYREIRALKGDYVAVREMRKIVGWFLHGVPGAARFRERVNHVTDPELLAGLLEGLQDQGAGPVLPW